ncbi:restriction endonuclease subunit S [Spiribacter sp. 218]|uniref:restriction endonuclease subunit S n=1 Tax=Spiribacter pallidus TaxID=1987936 RepID=UPI00349FA031
MRRSYLPINSVVKISSGKRPPEISKEKTPTCVVPVIGGGGVSGFTSKVLATRGSFITGRVGTLGKLHIAEEDCWPSDNALILRLNSEEFDNTFLRYSLSEVIEKAADLNRGAANPLLTQTDLGQLEISAPSLDEQRQIASILGALDDKIEHNRKMAATLEEMARALYRSWFVDFDPVHAKAAGEKPAFMDEETAALFPDRFGDDGLPEGWEQTKVGQLCTIRGGKQLSKDEFSEAGQYPVFGGAGRMGAADRYNAEGFIVTVGRVGAYCGNFYHTIGKAWVNNNASIIVPGEKLPPEFLYLALKYLDLSSIKKGAAQPFISNGDLAELEIVSPPAKLVRKAGQMFRYFFECLNEYDRENKTLATLRETLLPKLMSGEIRVGEGREQIEELT